MQVDKNAVEVVQVVVLVIVVVSTVVDLIKVNVEKVMLLALTKRRSCSFFAATVDVEDTVRTPNAKKQRTSKRMFV